jgi:phage baseplate assembly protein W
MIDISNTMLALSEDSATQEKIQDVARCLRTLYSTPLGSQEGDRSLGIDQGVFLDKPIEVAKALYVREVTEKTTEFEPRARVVRVDWQESDVVRGEVIPKVVYELV